MKVMLLYIAIFVLALVAIPMAALNFDLGGESEAMEEPLVHSPRMTPEPSEQPETSRQEESEAEVSAPEDSPQADLPFSENGVNAFLVLNESTGAVEEVSVRDFVRGAVAAEMPASFHSEALKAQAVAAHTFAVHSRLAQQSYPDPELQGADFSADPQNFKVYMDEDAVRMFYGDKFESSWKKICQAADAVLLYVLEYDDYPIVAAYHAISAGQTEDAANIWEGSAPYLQQADSEGDLLAPGYESAVTVPADEMADLLEHAYPGIQLGEDPAGWFGEAERSASGYVTGQPVGDRSVHGKEIRGLLGLRSHNYDIELTDQGFRFHVYGYGHGVGLSQYGADHLARQGKDFDDILANYYTGAVLKQVDLDL